MDGCDLIGLCGLFSLSIIAKRSRAVFCMLLLSLRNGPQGSSPVYVLVWLIMHEVWLWS